VALPFEPLYFDNSFLEDPLQALEVENSGLPVSTFNLTDSFLGQVKSMENDLGKGFNEETQTWFPHKSVEDASVAGGNDTIAYGHLLSDEEQANGYVYINEEKVPFSKLTTERADELFLQDWGKATTDAEKWFKGDWKGLTEQNQLLATELVFNMGLGKVTEKGKGFPKFKQKAIDNNPDVLNEINRTYKKDGKNVRTGRGDKIREYIRELGKT
tara:strand:+ start:19 stop:660 length:642 start_codon:yes stop_codon:yes gene_type:complete